MTDLTGATARATPLYLYKEISHEYSGNPKRETGSDR